MKQPTVSFLILMQSNVRSPPAIYKSSSDSISLTMQQVLIIDITLTFSILERSIHFKQIFNFLFHHQQYNKIALASKTINLIKNEK